MSLPTERHREHDNEWAHLPITDQQRPADLSSFESSFKTHTAIHQPANQNKHTHAHLRLRALAEKLPPQLTHEHARRPTPPPIHAVVYIKSVHHTHFACPNVSRSRSTARACVYSGFTAITSFRHAPRDKCPAAQSTHAHLQLTVTMNQRAAAALIHSKPRQQQYLEFDPSPDRLQ